MRLVVSLAKHAPETLVPQCVYALLRNALKAAESVIDLTIAKE